MNEQISLGGHLTRGFALGDPNESMSPVELRARYVAGTEVSVIMAGAIGAGLGAAFAPKHQPTAAIVGAVTGGTLALQFVAGGFCGFMKTDEEKRQIDAQLAPRRLGVALGGGAAMILGGVIGKQASKKHPTIGAIAGASIASGVVAVLTPSECPR